MDIAFAFDENYAQHARVAMESILQHHSEDHDITFWVMTTGNTDRLIREPLMKQTAGRAKVELLDCGESFRELPLSDDPQYARISPGMYLRLLLPAAVPSRVERLLYLDVDVLCTGSLVDLWETDIGPVPLAAAVDTAVPTVDSLGGLPGAPDAMSTDDPYFNSGVLLIDVPEWSRAQVTEKCFQYVSALEESFRFPDQDALNVATHRRWFELENKWNYMVNFATQTMRGHQDARLIHFAGHQKPWRDDFPIGELRSQYVALAELLPDS